MRIEGMVWRLLGRYRSRKGRRSGFRHLQQPAISIAECLEVRNLLAAFVVDTVVDELDADQSAGDFSLREALREANSTAGADSISFDASVFGTQQTIGLSLGELAITDSVTITGPGKDLLTVSGLDRSRVFNIDDGNEAIDSEVQISDLTVANGLADDGATNSTNGFGDDGGGLFSTEQLTLEFVRLADNNATGFGGGIRSNRIATLQNVDILRNTASSASAVHSPLGSISVDRAVVTDNVSTTTLVLGGQVHINRTTISGNRGGGAIGSGNPNCCRFDHRGEY